MALHSVIAFNYEPQTPHPHEEPPTLTASMPGSGERAWPVTRP